MDRHSPAPDAGASEGQDQLLESRASGSGGAGDCLFCRIASGEVESQVVFEDEIAVGFLDHRPLFPGHTLIAPREHYETLADLPAELIGPFFTDVQLLAKAIPAAMRSQGSFVAMNNVVSQSVPHLHVHVVPRSRKDGLRGFFWPRRKYDSDDHLREVAEAIRAEVAALQAS
jgi:histidine triad (HIT) family protein